MSDALIARRGDQISHGAYRGPRYNENLYLHLIGKPATKIHERINASTRAMNAQRDFLLERKKKKKGPKFPLESSRLSRFNETVYENADTISLETPSALTRYSKLWFAIINWPKR